jgi:hypothetical protein
MAPYSTDLVSSEGSPSPPPWKPKYMTTLMAMIATVRIGNRRVGMLSFKGNNGHRNNDYVVKRTAHPYDDTDVIDSRAPRFNQGAIGSLALLAFLLGLEWLPAVLAAQLAVGLTFGRQYCLPCLIYFELVQPRFGEGHIEDSRPPRFANMIGIAFLGGATLAFALDAATVGWVLTLIVAALALLAAVSGVCMGCEAYRLSARLRGIARGDQSHPRQVDRAELGLANGSGALVEFSHPLCFECREWERRLMEDERPHVVVDVSARPELAKRYGVAVVPTVVAVAADGTVTERLAP